MILLEEHGKTQEKLGTRHSVWTLPFNPKMLGSLQKGGLLSKEHLPFGSCSPAQSKNRSQGHPGYPGARSEVSALSFSQKREKILLGIRSLGNPR